MTRYLSHRSLITLLFVALLSGLAPAQMREEWNNIYDAEINELVTSVAKVDDGGFVLAGYQADRQNQNAAFLLKKLNAEGDLQFTRRIEIDTFDVCYDVIETAEGNFLLAGRSAHRNGDAALVEVNQEGEIIRINTYGRAGDDFAQSIIESPDGDFVFAGSYATQNNHGRDFWLVKSNRDGEVVWEQFYSVANNDRNEACVSLIPTADNGFLLAGYAVENLPIGFVVKTDSQGEIVWRQTYRPEGVYAFFSDGIETDDGGFVLFGEVYQENEYRQWLLKINSEGEVVWERFFDDDNQNGGSGYSIKNADEGGFFIAAHWWAGENHSILRRLDPEGNELWSMTFPGMGEADLLTLDDGLLLAGYARDGVAHAWATRLGPEEVFWGVPPAPEGDEDHGIVLGNEELDAHTFHHGRSADAFRFEVVEQGDNVVGHFEDEGFLIWPMEEFNGIDSLLVAVLDQDNAGDTAWVTCQFEAVNDPPSAPVLLLPENNSIVDADTVRLVWSASTQNRWETDNVRYQVYTLIRDVANLFITDDTTGLAYFGHIRPGLDSAVTVEWRVFARDGEFNVESTSHYFTLLPLGISSESATLPKTLSITAVAPNPFNNRTSISFATPVSGNIDLAVYDLSGKLVAGLANGRYSAGVHSVTWDASAQSAGIYLLKLSDGKSFAQIKRLVLLK